MEGNAEAGPSRLPYGTPVPLQQQQQLASATASATPQVPPPQPALPVVDPSGQLPSGNPPPAATPAGGSVRGPTIVPSILGEDGVKTVPPAFELCEVEDLITLIASMLDRLMSHNDRIPLTPTGLTRFHSRAPPSINVRDYLLRIARYTNVEPCCLLILLPYVDKVCAKMTTFTISSLTVHRFIIAGVSVGSKALSDSFCTNGRYARVGGVSITEMNLLEKEFCEAIDWRLTTTGTVLAHYYTSLVTAHPLYRLAAPPTTQPRPPAPTTLATPALAQRIPLPAVSLGDEDHSRRSSTVSLVSQTSDVSMEDGEAEGDSDAMEGVSGGRSLAAPTTGNSSSISPSSASSSAYSPRGRNRASASPSTLAQTLRSPTSPLATNSALPPHVVSDIPSSTFRTSSPALIPPPSAKRLATASNLPSPVRGAVDGVASPNPLEGLSFAKLAAVAGSEDRGRREWVMGSSSGSEASSLNEVERMSMSPKSSLLAKRAAAEGLERSDGLRRAGSTGVKGRNVSPRGSGRRGSSGERRRDARSEMGRDGAAGTGGAVVM